MVRETEVHAHLLCTEPLLANTSCIDTVSAGSVVYAVIVCQSVHLTVTILCSVKTAKHAVKTSFLALCKL